MKNWICRYGVIVGCLTILPFLSGCILVPVAAVGFGATKLVQMNMKTTFQVTFDTPRIEDRNALAGASRIALWPESRGPDSAFGQGETLVSAPMLSERLSGSLDTVTSRMVLQVLQSNSIPASLQDLTHRERLDACKILCDRTGADAVVCSSPPDMKVDSRYFTFKRATRTYAADLQAYSRAKDDFVWEDMVTVTVKQGSTLPSNTDIEHGVAEAVAGKLLELTGKKSVTPVNAGTNSPAKAQ